MRILYLSPNGAIGGAERALLDALAALRVLHPAWSLKLVACADGGLIEAARELDVATAVVSMPAALAKLGDAGAGGPAGAAEGRLRLLGRLALRSPTMARYLRQVRNAVAEFQPDLIHSNGFKTHLLGAWSVSGSSRLLWHLHDFLQIRPLMPRLMQIHRRKCAGVIANSHSVANDARSVLGPYIPLYTVYNAVDLDRFTPCGAQLDLDATAGLPPADATTVRVGLIATAARWKGQELFLHALKRLPHDGPAIRGYIIGGPIYQTAASQYSLEELRTLASGLGLAGRVGFTGMIRDVPGALRALDIVVHASTSPEPFGLVIAEAMASGRAVLTNALGGAGELVHAGEDAITYPAGDSQALADAIVRLACDPALRSGLGSTARRTAERHFTRQRMGREIAAIYQATLAASAGTEHAAAARP